MLLDHLGKTILLKYQFLTYIGRLSFPIFAFLITNEVLKDGWLCTGDLAFIDSYGLLHIKGRNDELIIRGGMNIYPQEIEAALKTDDRVREVLVYKYDNKFTGVEIGMKISGEFSNVKEVQKLCTQILPAYQIPSQIELLDQLKKNASGKIIRGVQNG